MDAKKNPDVADLIVFFDESHSSFLILFWELLFVTPKISGSEHEYGTKQLRKANPIRTERGKKNSPTQVQQY